MSEADALDLSGYAVTDSFFAEPYVDVDEWRDEPHPHRHVHGGFANCDTRFTFYFPAAEGWGGRMLMPLEGAHAGHEDFFGSALGDAMGGVALTARLGGYMVESNMGHIGDAIDPKGGEDPQLYSWRAASECARLSKHLAEQVYGSAPHHSYVWGGSGGGRRSPLVLENAPDVFDGALPFMGGGDIAEFPATGRIQGSQVMAFACMFNIQRMLRHDGKMARLIDAMQPGGSGNPYEGLSSHEREELATLYRMGFPRGDEFMAATPMGQIWLWTSIADLLYEQDPDYFEDFWTTPGYVGHDYPSAVAGDVIDTEATITKVVTITDLLTDPAYEAPEFMLLKVVAGIMSGSQGMDFPLAIEVDEMPEGYLLGAGVKVLSGAVAGRQLYVNGGAGNLLACDGHDEANLERFRGVAVGDRVQLDNRRFLAFCYFHRHHLMKEETFDSLRLDGIPIFEQHPVPYMSPLMGVSYTGHYEGKLLWIHHTHDSSLWPPQGTIYKGAVEATQGAAGAAERFRLQWSENAEHIPPMFLPNSPTRATSTWLIDYFPIIEQGLASLIRWVEEGVAPPSTAFEYVDGRVILPSSAAERGGVQPTISITANGGLLAEVGVGEEVTLEVVAEVPPAGGGLVSLEWDFDGWGSFPVSEQLTGADTELRRSTTTSYNAPGTYFATARVHGHVDADPSNPHRRLPNLASARIVVR